MFLGDLGVPRHRIGRLKLQLESAVDEEWVFFKCISTSRGYPVGSGAMVHVSAAKFIKQLEVPCPPGLDPQEWSLAVDGRILHLELDRPEAGGRIWYVGLNQHVAANDKTLPRELVLSTLAHITSLAQMQNLRLVIIGDANAAPAGGRWGYSHNTKTGVADQRMCEWLTSTLLREIHSVPLQPTWKACLLSKKATLDRAWIYPPDLPVSSLQVKWERSLPVFDHAMIMLQLSHTVAGLGFAGACRPLNHSIPLPRCRVNVRKFREPAIREEWSRLLQLSLTAFRHGLTTEQQDAANPGGSGNEESTIRDGCIAAIDSNMTGRSGANAPLVVDDQPDRPIQDVPIGTVSVDQDAGTADRTERMRTNDSEALDYLNLNGESGRQGNVDKEAAESPMDPFQALRYAELMAAQIAHTLAPRRIRKVGEVRRSFAFSGHRIIFRELNHLHAARAMVKNVISRNPNLLCNPHRNLIWAAKVGRLHYYITRSKHYCPPLLHGDPQWYFGEAAVLTLTAWLDKAKTALDVRWAAVREDIAKAKYINECRAHDMLIRSGGVLDRRLLDNALGKRQPRPRMWGVAGQIGLGLSFEICGERQTTLLEYLLTLPTAEGIVSVEGSDFALRIWFRGPRVMGDFLTCWCSLQPPFEKPLVRSLVPSELYVAIIPDDILAVQELHLAREGMDSESICPGCRKPGVQPIVTSAAAQPFGNPKRAVRFFCQQCCSVHDDVDLAELPPCPIPWQVWQEMRRIPPGLGPLICRPVDMETLENTVRRLRNDLSMGTDGIPREFYK